MPRALQIGLSLLLLGISFLFTAFTVQFVPPIFWGDVQMEVFLCWVGYFLLFAFLFQLFFKYWKYIAMAAALLPVLLSFFGVGWNFPTLMRNVGGYLTHARNRISMEADIKVAEGAIRPHVSLQQRIQHKVDSSNPEVRTFAVRHSLLYYDEYYSKYGQICRQFSLIRYIKENYKYVRDPNGADYFASPVESMELMAGDCDDYSILMASVLGSIGVKMRIVWAPNHVYPEMFCGDQALFDKYVSAIYTMFAERIGNKRINYRLDKNGDYWLNLDYTDQYPGSAYFSEEVLSIIYMK